MGWSCTSQTASGLRVHVAPLGHIILTLNPSFLLLFKVVPLSEKNKLKPIFIKFCQSDQTGGISNPRYTELEANTLTVTPPRRLENCNVHSSRFGRFRSWIKAEQRIYPSFADYCSNVLIFMIHHIRDVLQNMAKLDFRIDG